MNKKILFYFDNVFLNFFIAKSLKNKFNYKINGISIANTVEAKEFFNSQKLLEIDNLWYYPDHILKANNKPDLDYLKKQEKKYDFNYWLLASYDRKFHSKHNRFHKFSRSELLLIFEQSTKFFESCIEKLKPDFFIVTGNYAFEDILLDRMCKKLDIPSFVIYTARIGNRHLISQTYDSIDNTKQFTNTKYKTFNELKTYLKKNDMYESTKKLDSIYSSIVSSKTVKIKAISKFLLTKNSFVNHYNNYGKTKLKLILSGTALQHKINKKSRTKFIEKYLSKKIEDSQFIFFPLSFEPERSMLVGTPFFPDQIEVIRKIAKCLPIEYKIYVKEHPAMGVAGWRNTDFYKEILEIPNVRLIHPSVNTRDLYEKCSFVITLNGTSSIEANIYGKPSIIFGENSASEISSIIKIYDVDELTMKIQSALSTKVNPEEVGNFITKLELLSFDWSLDNLVRIFMKQFPYPGYQQFPKYPLEEMRKYYDQNKELFDIAAEKFHEKISITVEDKEKSFER